MRALHANMRNCQQTQGMNMLQHGLAVHRWYCALYAGTLHALDPNAPDLSAKALAWWIEYRPLLSAPKLLRAYHLYHDCGKPLCAEMQSDGRMRFPEHAQWSARQWAVLYPEDTRTLHLMAHDMDFHLARSVDYPALWALPYAHDLYATAWAELYANASMFGGFDSDSFKIKRKRLLSALSCDGACLKDLK